MMSATEFLILAGALAFIGIALYGLWYAVVFVPRRLVHTANEAAKYGDAETRYEVWISGEVAQAVSDGLPITDAWEYRQALDQTTLAQATKLRFTAADLVASALYRRRRA